MRRCVAGLVLGVSLLAGAVAAEPLKRRTIQVVASGKTVAEIMLPFDTAARATWNARKTEYGADGTVHLSGDVHVSVALGAVAPLTLAGDEMFLRSETLDAGTAQAIRDLQEMGKTDQSVRGKPGTLTAQEWRRQEAIDVRNMARLAEIVERYGWPGYRFGGMDTAQAAFLVLQHADIGSQHKYLPVLRAAVAKGDAAPADLALLEDRVLVRDGKPQLYGSQLKSTNPPELHPVQDPERLDRRRAEVGLPPIADYLASFRDTP